MSIIGLKAFICEPCIFANEDRTIVIGAYVDDLLVAAQHPDLITDLVRRISGKINITHKGQVKNFLGISVTVDRERITFDQSPHIHRLLKEQSLVDCNGAATPMPPGKILDPSEEDEFTNTTSYQSLVGSLLHIANFTRPDIGFAVGQLCRFMSAPRV